MRPAAAWRGVVGDGIESRERDEDPEARAGGVLVPGIPVARDRSCIGYVRTYVLLERVCTPTPRLYVAISIRKQPHSTVMLELARRRAQVVVQDDVLQTATIALYGPGGYSTCPRSHPV